MISDVRKKELIHNAQLVLVDLPQVIKGNESLVQEIINRLEIITKKPDEYKFMVDILTVFIQKSKGKEVQVAFDGKIQSREDLALKFGLIMRPRNKNIFGKDS